MKATKANLWIAVAIVAGLCVAIRFTSPVDDHIRYAAGFGYD